MTGMVPPTFSLAERDRRWKLTRDFMEREDLEALIVFGEHEDAGSAPFYYDTWFTNDRPGATVLVSRSGEIIMLAAFVTDQSGGDTAWVDPQNTRLGRHAAPLVDALKEIGVAKGTVGVGGLDRYGPWHPEGVMPYRLLDTVQTVFPEARFASVDEALALLIAPQSAEEIAVLRHSAAIGDEMVKAMVEAIAPGVPENEVYAAGMAAAHARGTIVPVMLLGSGPAPVGGCPPQWAFRPQPPRILMSGDIVRAEVFCGFGMRATQHQLTCAIGDVHEDFERAAAVARESYEAGLKAVRPGRTFGEVVGEMRAPVQAADGLTGHPVIHSINPFGARGGGLPTAKADMVLEQGMTFVLEPGCAFGRRKVTIGGTVVVGGDEPIELSPYTAQLFRVAVTANA